MDKTLKVIEENIVLTTKKNQVFKFLRKLKVGDSFVVENAQERNLYVSYSREYRKINKKGLRLSTRLQKDNSIRIWRVK